MKPYIKIVSNMKQEDLYVSAYLLDIMSSFGQITSENV